MPTKNVCTFFSLSFLVIATILKHSLCQLLSFDVKTVADIKNNIAFFIKVVVQNSSKRFLRGLQAEHLYPSCVVLGLFVGLFPPSL